MLLAVVFATPAFAQSTNWNGPYVGLNVGHGSGKGWEDAFDVKSVKGNVGGIEAGYDWRKNNVVFGIAGDMSASGVKGTETTVRSYTSSFDDYTSRTETTRKVALDRLGTIRGRLGYAAKDFLLYVTGGLALARVKTDVANQSSSTYEGISRSDAYGYKEVRNATGWVFGGGVEYAINRDFTVKAEYLRTEMQDMYGGAAVAPLNILRAAGQYRF